MENILPVATLQGVRGHRHTPPVVGCNRILVATSNSFHWQNIFHQQSYFAVANAAPQWGRVACWAGRWEKVCVFCAQVFRWYQKAGIDDVSPKEPTGLRVCMVRAIAALDKGAAI